ncbi:MAG: hypothetical protein O9284_03150 [Steroidobacteraceae bacterium]|jgi:hypothetical protein|nr:hypothetical protein [Steroidobacteraceae bacterium]
MLTPPSPLKPAKAVRVWSTVSTPRGEQPIRTWRIVDEQGTPIGGRDCHTLDSARGLARFYGYVIVQSISEPPADPAAPAESTESTAQTAGAPSDEPGAESAAA